jgi:hypothetical protein
MAPGQAGEIMSYRSTIVLLVVLAAPIHALEPPPLPGLNGAPKDELAGALRGLLLKNLPDPLYEAAPNWGHQSEGRRFPLLGKRRDTQVEMAHEPRNDGIWRKIRVEAVNPAESLVFDIRDVQSPEAGKVDFQTFTALDVLVNFHQQRWLSGIKVFDGKARAKARVKVTLDCEAATHIDSSQLLPELVFQLKVTKADLKYDNLKFEHIAGFGGEAAQIIGEAAHTALKQWRPSIERDLLARANAAIVKAGGEREVRLSLTKLLKSAPKAQPN